MALRRWTPTKNIEAMFHEMFEDPMNMGFWKRIPSLRSIRELGEISLTVDMYDNENEIVVKAEVPGVEKENINISIAENMLTIKGETKKEEEIKDEDYYYSERTYGNFVRTINLPAKVNEKKVKASFKDGILEIHMPKAAESKPKAVKVDVK